eukprot:m.144925 g.144925  ORF g.144925 m.144925 type:complete len:249 (+) comp16055_c0_seq1:247-993(+)
MLLEMGTGFHTGSVYTDFYLREIMPGEMSCNISTIAIKSHLDLSRDNPNLFEQLFTANNTQGGLPLGKCKQLLPFRPVIGVIRDPFHAALAETVRELTSSHTATLTHEKHASMQVSFINDKLLRQAELWGQYTRMYNRLRDHGWVLGKDLMLIRYEDMLSTVLRYDTLARLLQHVLGPAVASPHGPFTKAALDCIFDLANDSRIRRKHSKNDISPSDILTPTIVCQMWETVKDEAAPLGYTPPFDIRC